MRRPLPLLFVLSLCGLAAPALSQTPAARSRPQVAVVVVTLDQLRQIQAGYGRSALASLADEQWGRFAWTESTLAPDAFQSCEDERSDGRLDYCIRYYLTRAEMPADAPPTVVVAFDDLPAAERRRGGEMGVTCFGRGVIPADAAAQDTWLWPGSARVHGVNDWNRDRDALAGCIEAAASEAWTGLREPDVD